MKIFFFFGHPAQFHFYKNIVSVLLEKGNEIFLFIKTKDVLESLVQETGWEYTNVLTKSRGSSKAAILFSIIKRDLKIFTQVVKHRPDMLIGSDPSFAHAGFLFRIPCLSFVDDDADAAGYYASITYPFTSTIITPEIVKVGKWEHKRVTYKGNMKLAYLHPNWFNPDLLRFSEIGNKDFFLIRLSGLSAHHDSNIKGINQDLLNIIIDILSAKGKVIISSEKGINSGFENYYMDIPATNMHNYLAHAKLLISDSQSMSGEAAVLGIPSIRISSFKGKLSVLEELEHQYGLTFAFFPDDLIGIVDKINELLEIPEIIKVFQLRRQKLLNDKIDVSSFAIWFIENYPESEKTVRADPAFQNRFCYVINMPCQDTSVTHSYS